MDSTELQLEIEDGIATLTLNRPQAHNAMSVAMLETLPCTLQDLSENDEVRCVLVTGAGEQSFCAGGDISGMGEGPNMDKDELIAKLQTWARASSILHRMPKPTIAAINGVAAGAGMSLALACDLRYASPNASLLTAFAKLAMPGDFGGSYFMTQLVGPAKARELYFLSERISSSEAVELGLFNAVFDSGQLMTEVRNIAKRLIVAPTVMHAAMKDNLNAALTQNLESVLEQEARHMIHCAMSEETRLAAAEFFNNKK